MNPLLKYLLPGMILFLQAATGVSQMNIDSLQNALAKEKEDSITIAGYLESMTKLKSTEVEAKTIMAQWTLQKAEKLKSPYLVALANLRLGAIYLTNGKVENVLIPPMMIQPFVENAIKHAELKKIENPYIKVLIEIENNLLSISVRDNGVGLRKENIVPDMLSHSMSVIKTRIQLLFQEKSKRVDENIFTVTTMPEMEAGTMIKFFLPLNYAY